MRDIEETLLPGVGVRHEFTTVGNERLALLTHRTGRRELAVYERDDPDRCHTVLHLSAEDTVTLGELLGTNQVSATVAAVQRLDGVAMDWLDVPIGSPQVGRTIGDGQYRTKTGVSIVAIVRGETTLPAPGPDAAFEAGDVVVAVGTGEGLQQLRDLLVA